MILMISHHRRRKQFETGGAQITTRNAWKNFFKILMCFPLFSSALHFRGTAHARVDTKICSQIVRQSAM